MSHLQAVTAETFNTLVLESRQPVLVDFYADWCGPCKTQAPILEELVTTHGDKVQFVKVNVDSNAELARRYNVRSIPTLILFNKGEAVDVKVGLNSRNELLRSINAQA